MRRLAELAYTRKVGVLDISLGEASPLSTELLGFQKQFHKD